MGNAPEGEMIWGEERMEQKTEGFKSGTQAQALSLWSLESLLTWRQCCFGPLPARRVQLHSCWLMGEDLHRGTQVIFAKMSSLLELPGESETSPNS